MNIQHSTSNAQHPMGDGGAPVASYECLVISDELEIATLRWQ